jgi:hypothetical protein
LAFHSGREADHSSPSSADFRQCVELYLHSPICLNGVVLSQGEHRDNFTIHRKYPAHFIRNDFIAQLKGTPRIVHSNNMYEHN